MLSYLFVANYFLFNYFLGWLSMADPGNRKQQYVLLKLSKMLLINLTEKENGS